MLRPWQNVICSQNAHINWDECGAPERFLGSKLWDIPTPDGKLTPADDSRRLHRTRRRAPRAADRRVDHPVHRARHAVLARRGQGDRRHDPRARACTCTWTAPASANAAVSLGVELRDTTGDAGVDVLSFGGTKNGLMGGEAVVFFNPGSGGEHAVHPQAADAALEQDALHLCAVPRPLRGRPVASQRRTRQRHGAASA